MEIRELINQYNDKIVLLEQELSEIKRKRNVLQEALEVLDEESTYSGRTLETNKITVISDKYSNMTWPNEILLALAGKEMTGEQLLKELFENGFQSNSKSIKSDMYGRLKTLENRGEIIAKKEGKELKRYKLKQNEKESYFEDSFSNN